jgi:hypothetical protein
VASRVVREAAPRTAVVEAGARLSGPSISAPGWSRTRIRTR